MSRNDPTWSCWYNMKQRCTNPSNSSYNNWGGRGIAICTRWLESFDNFLEDMGKKPVGLSLDRVDNDGDYTLENCRWATDSQQQRNKRRYIWSHTNSKSGEKGIKIRNNRFVVSICSTYLGIYTTMEEAVSVRDTYLKSQIAGKENE